LNGSVISHKSLTYIFKCKKENKTEIKHGQRLRARRFVFKHTLEQESGTSCFVLDLVTPVAKIWSDKKPLNQQIDELLSILCDNGP